MRVACRRHHRGPLLLPGPSTLVRKERGRHGGGPKRLVATITASLPATSFGGVEMERGGREETEARVFAARVAHAGTTWWAKSRLG